MSTKTAIDKRRTFAIISHPDAGKTTLTEKFLLFGGAIHTAGAVKNNKIDKTAASDFMEIEKQRGISVATSVMSFEYDQKLVNLLDTPGHKDFAEDTYRTLSAVDSVVLVVDCMKGVEEQTEKLMEVCRMRNTPVIIFINKLDREGRDPYDLLDELESKLNINVRPLTWPINIGARFKGVYDLYNQQLNLFQPSKTDKSENYVTFDDLQSPELGQYIGEDDADQLREDAELVDGVYEPFDRDQYLNGQLAPVFFGSAINNFGVQELLDTFVNIAPQPVTRETSVREVSPEEEKLSGFVFKIHANIDPKHRDRIAFFRICSGKFQRNKFYHHVRMGKKFRYSNPYSFMARSKEILEEAYPGDVIGLYDTGNFKIGDTLTEGENLMYKGIPSFSPEIFREVVNTDPMRAKQFHKGLKELTEEGVAQLFTKEPGNRKIIGVVGELQLEVIKYRLENEYKASCRLEAMNYHKACWLTSDNEDQLKEFIRIKNNDIAYDKDNQPVFLAQSEWLLNLARQDYPDIVFHTSSEFHHDVFAEG